MGDYNYVPGMRTTHGITVGMFRVYYPRLFSEMEHLLDNSRARDTFNTYMFGHLPYHAWRSCGALSGGEILDWLQQDGLGDMLHVIRAIKRTGMGGGLAQKIEDALGLGPAFRQLSPYDLPIEDLSCYAPAPPTQYTPGITESHGLTLGWLKLHHNKVWCELHSAVLLPKVAKTIVTYFFGRISEWSEELAMRQHEELLDVLSDAHLGDAIHMVLALRRAGRGSLASKLVTTMGLENHRNYLLHEYDCYRVPAENFSWIVPQAAM